MSRFANILPEEKHLALAETVIERAAFYNERLREAPHTQQASAKSLWIEFLITRIALVNSLTTWREYRHPVLIGSQAWRQDRLDLAKAMLTKLSPTRNYVDPPLAEELSDLLFEIGKDLIKKLQWVDASSWLEAAYDVLAAQNPECSSIDAGELRVGIVYSMVKSLAHQDSVDSREKAWNIVRELSIEQGDKLIVQLLKLDLLASDPSPSAEDYRDTLSKIAGSVHLTDSNVSTMLHHIHKLKTWDSTMAHAVLFNFLADRLIGGEHEVWLEKTLITIVWNCTTSVDFPTVLATLRNTFDVATDPIRTISPSATHAAQVLLWKRVEAAYNQEMYEVAESWCRLSLHEIFGNSGSMNKGKLQRKLILCALGMLNANKALEVVATMSEANKSDASTQYLLYKVALRCQDAEMAAQCLSTICSSSTKDGTLLYACVLEAQRVGDQGQIITALQRVLEQFNYSTPPGVHLPALLRCNARLLMRSIDNLTKDDNESLCKVFEGAATQAKRSRRQAGDNLFTVNELDWFSRNCYNLALRVCHSWPPHQTLRVVHAALKFIDIYPSDLDPAILSDLSLRRVFCDFVLCSICIHLARNEDNIESQLQHYLSARHSVSDWRSNLPQQQARLEGGALADLTIKHNTLLAYDFEAAARLKAWDDFDTIIVECQECKDTKVFAILADVVLASEAPTEVILKSLQKIVNATWQIENINIEKLSRWIRCLTSQALSSDANTAENILDQAVIIVENVSKSKEQEMSYPAEELEWLATTTFNRAIDFYCSSQDVDCRRWAEKALKLGALCKDGGSLYALLQEKFQNLVWEDR